MINKYLKSDNFASFFAKAAAVTISTIVLNKAATGNLDAVSAIIISVLYFLALYCAIAIDFFYAKSLSRRKYRIGAAIMILRLIMDAFFTFCFVVQFVAEFMSAFK